MTKLHPYRHLIFLGSFYVVSLCLIQSWAEKAPDPLNINDSNSTVNSNEEDVNNVNNIGDKIVGDSEHVHSAVQSSIEEVVANNGQIFSHSQFAFNDVVSQNSGLPNEITDTGQALVFTLADTATAELQQRADIPSAITSHNETPNLTHNNSNKLHTFTQAEVETQNLTVQEEALLEESFGTINQKTEEIELETVTVELKENKTESTEDIPSFSEWAQKQLEEAEKKKELVNTSSQANNLNGKSGGSGKVRSKNYASLDCGAKIVAANPEAASSSSVLSSSRDEYMLNACTNRIWFIVELCEAVQAKKIDLANFELFSSLPKEFSIYVSDRYPSRDWLNVGHFTAKEERDVQTFDLHPQLFGKFVKFEMHSYYGSEHFCPISLFRVYGTSEFEVLEKENQAHMPMEEDDDDDEAMDSDNGQAPKNLFSSATDAVISIVKKAAEVLGNKANNSNYTNEAKIKLETKLENQCKTPSHLVVCDNCSDVLYDDVYGLLSCKSGLLYSLFRCDLIQKTLYNTDICAEYGLNFRSKRTTISKLYNEYVRSFFSKKYLAALCNTAAIIDNKVVLNISKHFPNSTNEVPKELDIIETIEPHTIATNKTDEIRPTEELIIDKIQLETSIPNELNISNTSHIKPTKTLTPDNNLNTHISAENKDDTRTVQPTESLEENHENITSHVSTEFEVDENVSDFEGVTESPDDIDLISELNNLASIGSNNIPPTPNTTPQVKETVILRLSNRIKALERNMSLSSQYLEELSRRYKRQVEEIQRLLDKTIVKLGDEGKKHDERIRKLESQIGELTAAVQMLVDEKNNWMTTTYWLFLVVVLVCCIFTFCGKKESKQSGVDRQTVKIQRRKSIDVVNHNEPAKKIRRPSEEALKITGTYKDLMKDDVELKKRLRERKRKRKKNSITRSNSIGTLIEESIEHEGDEKPVSSIILGFRPSQTSYRYWNRQESSPPIFPDWEASRMNSDIEDIPFVLEESENSPLEFLPIPKPLQTEAKSNGNISQKSKNIPVFLKTAHETRLKRKENSNVGLVNGRKEKNNHRKSGSLDETARQSSPTPSAETGSLNIIYDDVKKVISPKKDKKGAIKRILKKVFPSDV